MNLLTFLSIGCGFALLPMLTHAPQDPAAAKINHYIGSSTCKSCHNDAAKGGAYDHWAKTKHAKAFETLATAAAKAVGKKLDIADPQKSEKCLKCHVTAYGLDGKEFGANFKPADGVQCESCHGPGEAHKKKRFAEAGKTSSPITADEIRVSRSVDTCTKCHNEESPSYKPFCLKERMKDIEHLDPRKKRSDEDLAKLRATDAPDCKVCKGAKKEGEEKKDEKK